jgi:hypothetical protein
MTISTVSEALTGILASSGNTVEAAAPVLTPAVQQDEPPPQHPPHWLEAAYGCVDWFLYPQTTMPGGAG